MKGIIFREFLDMVESQFSAETADRIIAASTLSTEGAYTAVGTYPHQEIVQLVSHLSASSGIGVPALLRHFGNHLFKRLADIHPGYAQAHDNAFSLLCALDRHIHREVRKLYGDAELPSFDHQLRADGHLILTYTSRRGFADLALGLLEGCIAHFGEAIRIERLDLPESSEGARTQFTLIRSDDGQGR